MIGFQVKNLASYASMFAFFESKEKKVVKSHMRHLVRLANADGVLHKNEVKFIKKIALANGLSEREINNIIERPTDVEIVIPESRDEKFYQIFDLVQLMMKDGEVNDAEMEFCMEVANRLGFKRVIVGVLLEKISRGINGGLTREELKDEAAPFINY